MIHAADNRQKLGQQCLDSASVETIDLLLQYGANIDAFCDTRSPDEPGYLTEPQGLPMSVEEILRRVYPDKSRLLTLLAEARERRSRRQLGTGITEWQDTGTTLPALHPQRALLGVQSDLLRSDCVETTSGIVETRGDWLKTRGEKPEPEKRKRRRRLWAFLKRGIA